MYNVASGPAVYPKEVLEKISQGILNYKGTSMSTLELGHRSELFYAMRDELVALTKEILEVPDDFSILYLQGGGRLHFAQIPMNFLEADGKVQFIDTGYWSSKAAEYAQAYGRTEMIASSKEDDYRSIPTAETNDLDGKYLQYCANNTIRGTQFHTLPKANIPVVVDMSSEIFSRSIDFQNIDLVVACAQKNFGPAGLSLIIIKNDLLSTVKDNIPAIFNYKVQAEKNSNYNTPPIFQMCASLEMMHWIKKKGGLTVLEQETKERAALLYDAIDKSSLVSNDILPAYRSIMNIVFDAKNERTTEELKQQFAKANIVGINGHKTRGGFRVGNYIGQSAETIQFVSQLL